MRRATIVFAALLALAPAGARTQGSPPLARTDTGVLAGTRQGGVAAFLGVPFAAPPTGDARWRAPGPAPRWPGTRTADRFGASCPQTLTPDGFGPWTREYVVNGPVSEDCLFLNVWSGARPGAKRPVVVWIHGGGFNSGSGSVPIYDGRALAAGGVVVVTVNYRLGLLGFLAHPELTREAAGAPPANFGLQDQVAALRWVRRNIAVFGGDPDAVTIAGQSAGSMSVHALVASPLAAGLFRRAIAESGLPGILPTAPLADAERDGQALARQKGVASLAELRALPVDRLMAPVAGERPNPFRFGPVVDGVLLPDDPGRMVADGRAADVPMIVGQNADEGSAMSPGYGATTADDFTRLLRSSFGPHAGDFAALYPGADPAERARSSKALLRDRGLASLWAWSRDRQSHGHAPAYAYLFTHVEPGPDAARYGAFHSSEIPYALGTLDTATGRAFAAVDRRVSLTLSGYWLNFIKTGDPNGAGLAAWPMLRHDRPELLVVGAEPKAAPLLPPATLQAMRTFIDQGGRVSLF